MSHDQPMLASMAHRVAAVNSWPAYLCRPTVDRFHANVENVVLSRTGMLGQMVASHHTAGCH